MLSAFRRRLYAALAARRVPVPLLATTATLPPPLVEDLRAATGSLHLQVVRAPSTRSNVALAVVQVDSRAAAVTDAIRRVLAALGGGDGFVRGRDRIMIFATSIQLARQTAAALTAALTGARSTVSVQVYHGDMDPHAQAASVEDWRGVDGCVMVATSGLSNSVDERHVLRVVHLGAHSVVDLVQEIGRAGRTAADTASSVLVLWPTPTDVQRDPGDELEARVRVAERPRVLEYAATKGFSRAHLPCHTVTRGHAC